MTFGKARMLADRANGSFAKGVGAASTPSASKLDVIAVNARQVKATENGLVIRDLDTGAEESIPADTVILAVGFTPDRELYNAMQECDEVYAIGDCKEFHNVHSAVWDAFEVANHI